MYAQAVASTKRERKIPVTITVHKALWKTFQTLTAAKKAGENGKKMSASEHIEVLIKKANTEMSGVEQPRVTENLADLENQQNAFATKLNKNRELLEEHGTFKDLWILVASMGLDDTYAQADEVIDALWKAKDAKTLNCSDLDLHLLVDRINLHVKLRDALARKEELLRRKRTVNLSAR